MDVKLHGIIELLDEFSDEKRYEDDEQFQVFAKGFESGYKVAKDELKEVAEKMDKIVQDAFLQGKSRGWKAGYQLGMKRGIVKGMEVSHVDR